MRTGLLSPIAQWELHRFYDMSNTRTDDEARARMRAATELEPSLAQKVGTHYKLIFTTFKKHSDVEGKTKREEIRRRVIADYKKRRSIQRRSSASRSWLC